MFTYRKVGGLNFLKAGRLTLSWSVSRRVPTWRENVAIVAALYCLFMPIALIVF